MDSAEEGAEFDHTRPVTKDDICRALREIGLQRGDTILVHSALKGLGPVACVASGDRLGYCQAIFDCFDAVLGVTRNVGTLIVPTFTHDYVRRKQPFVLEETPSEVGIFSEYVRRRPDAVRTLHPISSVSVVGRRKTRFLRLSTSAYGMNSAFDVLARIKGAKVVYFGANILHTTLVHHVEHLVGVSYVYNKAYEAPAVYAGGRRIQKRFFSAVRYLNGQVMPDYSKLELRLADQGLLLRARLNSLTVMGCEVRHVIRTVYEAMQEDQCSLLEKEYYTTE